jgi:predicted NAD-dependent protein-ADP-ribosyltransferase YbiA (DUF1768 family)
MSDKKRLEDGIINFFSGKKDYRSLSNFWEKDVHIMTDRETRVYESGEHCFHGEKYIRIGLLCENKDRKIELLDYGSTFLKTSPYKTSAIAKKMGGKKGLLLNGIELDIWSNIGIDVQTEICKWKFDNYEEVRLDLLKSGNKILIHPALRCAENKLKNRIWEGKGVVQDGKIVVLGKNMLGLIWMELRKGLIPLKIAKPGGSRTKRTPRTKYQIPHFF